MEEVFTKTGWIPAFISNLFKLNFLTGNPVKKMEDVVAKRCRKKVADMTPEEHKAHRKYYGEYRKKNRDCINKLERERWRRSHPKPHRKSKWETSWLRWSNHHKIRAPNDDEEFKQHIYKCYEEQETCELCYVKLEGKGKEKKCLDHQHASGYPRFICCAHCNIQLAKVDRQLSSVLLEL